MRATKSIISILFIVCFTHSFAIPPGVKENVAKCIVRVNSGNKYSTGFFWSNGETVVTTLHALNSSDDIRVYIPRLGAWKPVTLRKVLKGGDLVSLKVSGYISEDYLSEHYSTIPPVDREVFTIGYNAGSRNYIDKDFVTGLMQGNTLEQLLPVSLHQEIRDLKFPSLSARIVYLKGNLLHGFSGAPIVDKDGKLVGVADGGLQNGAAGISWCISSSHLPTLESSVESFPILNHARINVLFASEDYEEKEYVDEESIEIGGFYFKKTKTRAFSELDMTAKYSSLDAWGLKQLLFNFNMYNYNSFEYDIYLEETSGATFVLPSGSRLRLENGLIVAGNDKMKFYLSINTTWNIQRSSELFEFSIMPFYANNWGPDPVWTYPAPYPGPDNSSVRRRAYFGNAGRHYLFEALAAKGQYFLGAAAKRDNAIITPYDLEEWAKYAIAIQLTTFSN